MIRQTFDTYCDGLVNLVRDAADPDHPRTQPYRGDIVGEAVWVAKFVIRAARRMGLYPETAYLEAESRRAA